MYVFKLIFNAMIIMSLGIACDLARVQLADKTYGTTRTDYASSIYTVIAALRHHMTVMMIISR